MTFARSARQKMATPRKVLAARIPNAKPLRTFWLAIQRSLQRSNACQLCPLQCRRRTHKKQPSPLLYCIMSPSQQPLLHSLPQSSPWGYGAGFLGVIIGMTLLAFLLPAPSHKISVAFAGNSMIFVNDLPR